MKAAPIKSTVRNGSLRIDVREYADGRFGFDFMPSGEERKKVRCSEIESAEEKAREILGLAKGGKVERLAINEPEYVEFLRWKAEKGSGAKVATLVESFLLTKKDKGLSMHHTRQIGKDLEAFVKAFPVQIEATTRAGVEKWLDSRNVGPRRWNNIRESVVALYRFARREGIIGAQLAGAELIERKRVEVTVETYTPSELVKIINAVPREWLPAIVLGAFAGMRPQELCPEPRSGKPGLVWGNILWSKGKIDVPARVSKTRKRRFAPLLDAAVAFLSDRKGENADEPVCPRAQLSKRTGEWGRASGVPWKNDALRHSFASYRLALTLNLPALALEMGNSPAMIHRHYLDLKHDDEAAEWFGIRPDRASNILAITS